MNGDLGHMPWRQRARVRLTRWRLDSELAEWREVPGSPDHVARAAQLAARAERRDIARALRRVVGDAEGPPRPWGSRARVDCPAVITGREALLGLADLLAGPRPVSPRGVARARLMLLDGSGPLYNPRADRTLADFIWWVVDGLMSGREDDLPMHMAALELGEGFFDL